jgi:hypothetical protein
MRFLNGLALVLVLAACTGSPPAPEHQGRLQSLAAQGLPLDRAMQRLMIEADQLDDAARQAWQKGHARYCADAGHGWRRGVSQGPAALADCDVAAFQAAQRMGRQWREWLQEHHDLGEAIVAAEGAEADQMRLRRQRLERDLDMLRGIASTRGYPMQGVPDWREPEQMPRPELEK